ncbi:heparinase II/III family protein [Amycolatopsis thermoflava]|uniref:heparinase II/III family protein n=1 Tax=Amycolatopsis thermoflava TaxID=84480 RepID=UPI00366068D8
MTAVEKPPHVAPVRMLHIPDADLLAEFDAPDLRTLRARLAARNVSPAADTLRWAGWAAGRPAGDKVIAEARRLLNAPVDFLDPAHGRSGLYGFHYLHWAQPLTRAAALTGDDRYPVRFAEITLDWYASREKVRGEWPGLDVVWYTLGVAGRCQVFIEALHVLGGNPALPDEAVAAMARTLLGGARWLAEEHDAFRHGNWQLAGCSVLAQIAAFLPELPESPLWSEIAIARLREHLELDVYADGGHYERAPSYHTMCLGALQLAAVAGECALGWDLADHPRLAAMHDWLLAMTAPPGWVPPFNDSHLVASGEHLLRGHHLLGRPEYKAAALRWVAPERIAEVLSWLPPRPGRGDPLAEFEAAPSMPPNAEPAAHRGLLPHSKFVVQRSGSSEDAAYAAVNCGPLIEHELESHSHRTVLDLVLAANGEPLLWEAGGPDSYDDPGYYDWYRAPLAHSGVLLPGHELADEHDADVLVAAALPTADILVAEHHGYPARHRRTLVLVRGERPYWVLTDAVTEPFRVLLHGIRPWVPVPGGHRSDGGPGLLVLPGQPERARAVDLGTGRTTTPGPGGARTGQLYGLGLDCPAGAASTVLVPLRTPTEPLPDVSEVDGPGGAVLVRRGRFADLVGPNHLVRTTDGNPVAAVSWGACDIQHAGRALLGAGRGLRTADIRWSADGADAEVECTARTALRLAVAPQGNRRAAAVLVNDVRLEPRCADGVVSLVLPAAGRWRVRIERSV